MAAFFEDIEAYRGTIERNEAGQTLEEFLEAYDPYKYKNPCVTTDMIVIRSNGEIKSTEEGLQVLMIQRRNHPSIGMYALPGGFVEIREDIMDGAKRELLEETGLSNVAVQQLATWGEPNRDPRARIITTSFLALVDDSVQQVKAGDDAKDACWMKIRFNEYETIKFMRDGKEKICRRYRLFLDNEERGVKLSAKIAVTENVKGILREPEFTLFESEGIAADHAKLIAHALLYIERNI